MKSALLPCLVLFGLFCTILLAGCSDGRMNTEPVTGIITLDGVPLDEATVGFAPKVRGQGAVGFGRTDKNGVYVLQAMNGRPDAGTLPGEYAVTVAKYKLVPTGRMETESGSGKQVPEMKGVLMFPDIYADSVNTPFSATVVKGKNQFDFDVKSKP